MLTRCARHGQRKGQHSVVVLKPDRLGANLDSIPGEPGDSDRNTSSLSLGFVYKTGSHSIAHFLLGHSLGRDEIMCVYPHNAKADNTTAFIFVAVVIIGTAFIFVAVVTIASRSLPSS